jgi:tetratricopeptide (TPR) repeat protein
LSVNNVAPAVQSLINRPTETGLAVALGISVSLILIALVVVMSARRRWIGLALGIVGLIATMAELVIVEQQTITIRESPSISVTRPFYRERTRAWARGGMVALPGLAVLVTVGAWAAARARLRKSVPALVKAGKMHVFLKEYDPAVAEFSRAIRISPFLAEAYLGRGAAYEGLGDHERALADFDQAIQCDPRLAQTFIQRARIRTETGDLDGAFADLSRVMELQPSDPEVYLNRGVCLLKKGLMADAAADFQRVLKLTNHSDFAEPAKAYLQQLGDHAAGVPYSHPLPPPLTNGVPDTAALPDPRPKDHTI